MAYNKVNALKRLENLGLKVHTYQVCTDIEEITRAVEGFGYVCTLRSDRDSSITGFDYPFFKVSTKEELNGQIAKIHTALDNGYVFIVANGLKYDKYLYFNIVFKIDRDMSFRVEFSRKNVPLRHMYNYPSTLNYIEGSLLDPMKDWYKIWGDQFIDLRILKEFLNSVKLADVLYGKYIEASVYRGCDLELAYWEVR